MEVNSIDDHSKTIIHIDIDCFYAQVEINKNPSLRTKPVGIQQKNIVVTSNYIARDYGIKKCMLISEAKKLCPNLILVNGEDLHDYRRTSYEVTTFLQKYSNLVERLGMDENFIDVSSLVNDKLYSDEYSGHIFGDISDFCDCGCAVRLKTGSIIAKDIRNQIFKELKLTTSAGIAHNKILAKLVCTKHKPNDQTIVLPNSAVELMLSLDSISSIPGIGTAMTEKLNSIQIFTISHLQNADYEKLCQALDKERADWIYNISYGIDKRPVKCTGKPLSIGIEDSCKSISAENELREKISQLLQRLLILVKEDGRVPKTIKLTVRKFDKTSKVSTRETRQCSINSNLFNIKNLAQITSENENKLLIIIMRLFSKLVDLNKPYTITLIGLSFTKFLEKLNIKSTLDTFLRKDIEVQSITNIENLKTWLPVNTIPSTSKITESDGEIEPNPKKYKQNDLKPQRNGLFLDSEDLNSPSKLKVAELRLNSTDTNQNICCPPNADENVFRELPNEVQKELWEDYKRQKSREQNIFSQSKKSKPNNIMNYFIKQ